MSLRLVKKMLTKLTNGKTVVNFESIQVEIQFPEIHITLIFGRFQA